MLELLNSDPLAAMDSDTHRSPRRARLHRLLEMNAVVPTSKEVGEATSRVATENPTHAHWPLVAGS